MSGPRRRTIVITGASGNIGHKVAAYLGRRPDLDLVLIDRTAPAGTAVLAAELNEPGPWMSRFQGADTAIHLAANPNIHARWSELVADNVDATVNVLESCLRAGVRRLVFASSVQVATGHENCPRITPELPPSPTNLYGASKSVGERLALAASRRGGLSVVCLRLGMVRRGANPPPVGHPSLAVQQLWLSNRDLCRIVELAVDASLTGFWILNATSDIAGSPWSLEEARRVIGYEPTDHYVPVEPTILARLTRRVRQALQRMRRHE